MNRLLFALLLAVGVACASTPSSEDPAHHPVGSAARLEFDRAVAARLRRVSTRVLKGEGTRVREELLAQAHSRPDDPVLQLQLAWTGAPSEEAWQELHRLAKFNPEEPWFPTACGLVYLQWGRRYLDQAHAELERAARLRSDFLPARVALADALRLEGRLPEAVQAYEVVLAKQPEWEDALVGLGLAQLALGDAKARATLERAAAIDPDDLRVVTALGRLSVQGGDTETAIRYFAKRVEFDPRDREARFSLAQMREQKGDLAGAAADYEQAAALASDKPVLVALARIYRALKRAEEEARTLELLAQAEPKDPAPLLRLAELRRVERDLEAAEVALRQASERAPGDLTIVVALARLAREREDYIAAIEAFRQAKDQGAREVGPELKEAEAKAWLPEKPLVGSVGSVYLNLFRRLRLALQDRQKQSKGLGGKLSAKVSIGEDGKVTAVELVEDSVHDAVLSALVYFGLKDAAFPKEKKTPTFEFVLGAR